jgi:hypothetical protein
MSQSEPLFLDTVRSDWKREIMTVTQEDFRAEARAMEIPVRVGALSVERMKRHLAEGGLAIVLISTYRLTHERVPHWVLAYDFNERYIFVHDPWIDTDSHESHINKAGMAIPIEEFERMSVYGKARLRAAVVVHKPAAKRRPAKSSRTSSAKKVSKRRP